MPGAFLLAATIIVAATVYSVEAKWYMNTCHVGWIYKVRLDPATGNMVLVPPTNNDYLVEQNGGLTSEGVFHHKGGNPFSSNFKKPNQNNDGNNSSSSTDDNDNNNNNDSEGDDDSNTDNDTNKRNYNDNDYDDFFDGEGNKMDDDPVANMLMPGMNNDQEEETSEKGFFTPPPTVTPNYDSQDGDPNQRTLRSKHIWRVFDDEDEEERNGLVLSSSSNANTNNFVHKDVVERLFGDNPKEADPSIAESFRERFLTNDHETLPDYGQLNEGEYYVRPCMCPDSRWTFSESSSTHYDSATDTIVQQPEPEHFEDLPATRYNATSDTLVQQPFHGHPISNYWEYPRNVGLKSLQFPGYYVYQQDNPNPLSVNSDLYLCNVQAAYCGLMTDNEQQTTVMCYQQNMRHIIARNAWPLILLWYFGLAIICCCTVHGRSAGDYVHDRVTHWAKRACCVCCWFVPDEDNDDSNSISNNTIRSLRNYDFNHRMLERMLDDDRRERQRRQGLIGDDDESENANLRNCFYTNQRRQFERSLMAQVQWIWRHQEYIREQDLRQQGLPPPQLKIKTKRFCAETSSFGAGFCSSPPPEEIETKKSPIFGRRLSNGSTSTQQRRMSNEQQQQLRERRLSNEQRKNSVGGSSSAAAEDPDQEQRLSNEILAERRYSNGKQVASRRMSNENQGATRRHSNERQVASRRMSNEKQGATRRHSNEKQGATRRFSNELRAERRASNGSQKPSRRFSNGGKERRFSNGGESLKCTLCPSSKRESDEEAATIGQGDEDVPRDVSANENTEAEDYDGYSVTEEEDDLDSLEVPTCTICFCPFEEGDIIADLPCKHEFHVECLKGWVQRKNACPLCNVPLGKPERPPLPPVVSGNDDDANNDNSTTSPGNSRRGSFLQRLSFSRASNNTDNSNTDNSNATTAPTFPAVNAGEIHRGNRVGMIAAQSAIEDINATARNRAGMFGY